MKPLRLLAAAVIAAAALSGCTTHPAAEPPPLRPGVAVGDRLTGTMSVPRYRKSGTGRLGASTAFSSTSQRRPSGQVQVLAWM